MDVDIQPGKALHLVQVVEDMNTDDNADMTEGFVVNEEAARHISSIQGNIAVLGIAGAYRSGKSFLVNKMIGRKKSFVVGHSIRSCTRGIWCYSIPLPCTFEGGENGHVLILDTEGLGSTDRSSHYDDQVFSLATLISSKLIYNSVGTIDEKSIQKLSFVGNLCKILGENSKMAEKEGKTMDDFVPKFVWVLRDFSLKLVDEEGGQISPNEYMENNLESKKGYDKRTMQRNRVCDMLRSFFRERECHTLIVPAANENVLQNIEEKQDQLRPEFLQQVQQLRTEVLGSLKPKTVSGCAVNGAGFVSLVRTYIGAINGGAVPSLADAWTSAVQTQCAQAKDAVIKKCLSDAKELRKSFPLEEPELRKRFRELSDEGLMIYDKKAPPGNQITKDLRKELVHETAKIEDDMMSLNSEKSEIECQTLSEELFQVHISGPLTSREQKQEASEESDTNGDDNEDDLALLFGIIWNGYRIMRKEYFAEAIGPAKVVVIEKLMLKLEAQTQRAITVGERRLDEINAELKTAQAEAEGMASQLKSVREELIGEKKHRAKLTYKNAQLSESLKVITFQLEETKDALVQKTLQYDSIEAELNTAQEKINEMEVNINKLEAQIVSLEQMIQNLEESLKKSEETVRLERKRRAGLLHGLKTGQNMAQSIRAQQAALIASMREQARSTIDEVQTLEFKLYGYLQMHLNMKKEQVDGLLIKHKNLTEELNSALKAKVALQDQYDQLKSQVNRREALREHDESEVDRINAKLQDEIVMKEKLKAAMSKIQKKYEREKRLRQEQAKQESRRKKKESDDGNPFDDDDQHSDKDGSDNPFGGSDSDNPFNSDIDDDNRFGSSDEDRLAESKVNGQAIDRDIALKRYDEWDEHELMSMSKQHLIGANRILQSRLDLSTSLAIMKKGVMLTKLNYASNTSSQRWLALSLDHQVIRWAKSPQNLDKGSAVNVSELVWIYWGHKTKVQLRNFLQNQTSKRQVEEYDPWLVFSFRTAERSFDFYCHNRVQMDQVMFWVHSLGRLIFENRSSDHVSRDNGSASASSSASLGAHRNRKRRKSVAEQHKPLELLSHSRLYRASMMWRKLINGLDKKRQEEMDLI